MFANVNLFSLSRFWNSLKLMPQSVQLESLDCMHMSRPVDIGCMCLYVCLFSPPSAWDLSTFVTFPNLTVKFAFFNRADF